MNGPNKTSYKQKTSVTDYDYIMIDISWVDKYLTQNNLEILFNRVNIYELVEIIASQTSIDQELDSEIWCCIESKWADDQLQYINFDSISIIIELLKEEYFNYVDSKFNKSTSVYIYHSWIDRHTLLLMHESLKDKA